MSHQRIEWLSTYNLGIDDIDFQHHFFLNLINRLAEELSTSENLEYRSGLIAELNAYARFHFISEENMMLRAGYPRLAEHRQHHHKLLEQLSFKENKLIMRKSEQDAEAVIDFLAPLEYDTGKPPIKLIEACLPLSIELLRQLTPLSSRLTKALDSLESGPINGKTFKQIDSDLDQILKELQSTLPTLYDALELLKHTGIHPVIYEESDETGGIARTVKKNGYRLDVGPHRYFSKREEILDIWTDLMDLDNPGEADSGEISNNIREESGILNNTGKLLIRKRLSRIYFNGK